MSWSLTAHDLLHTPSTPHHLDSPCEHEPIMHLTNEATNTRCVLTYM